VSDGEDAFDAPFFDLEDEHFVKTDLWMIGDVAIGLMNCSMSWTMSAVSSRLWTTSSFA
jgi:hypothetical protein